MMITTHFSDYEFMCPHCGNTQIKHDFVKHLEELYMLLDSAIGIKSIIVNILMPLKNLELNFDFTDSISDSTIEISAEDYVISQAERNKAI